MMWDGMRACAWCTRSGLALVAATALAIGGSPARAENVEAEVKAVGAAFGQACEKGDVAAVVALYDDRASAVFPGDGQEAKGKLNLARLIGEAAPKSE